MKKYKKVVLILAMALILVGIGTINYEKVSASSDIERKSYFEGDTAYIDLDGDGKKESISIRVNLEYSYYGSDSWELIINGKSMGEKYLRSDWQCEDVCFEILDIYQKDKYKEIGVNIIGCDQVVAAHYEAYRYTSGKCTLVFADDDVGSIWDEQNKKNHILVEEGSICDLGMVFYKVDYVIEDKELVKAKNKSRVCEYSFVTDEFTANQSITIYKKNSLKKKVGVIKKGEKFKVVKLKFSKSGKIVAAYIKVDKNRKGWIDVSTGCSRYGENALVKDPIVGG